MKTLYATLLVFAVAFIASPASAQKDVENEALNVPMFSAAYAYQFPGAIWPNSSEAIRCWAGILK